MSETDFLRGQYVILTSFILIFIVWLFVYLNLHNEYNKHQGRKVVLTGQQIGSLNSIEKERLGYDVIDSRSKTHQETTYKKHQSQFIKFGNEFLRSNDIEYVLSEDILAYFTQNKDRVSFVNTSYFFLEDIFFLIEILFFALIGLICNALYNISEHITVGGFKSKVRIVYYVKLIYASVITLIIYLGIDSFGSETTALSTTSNTLALSFILGFFLGKSIVLLNRPKELIMQGEMKRLGLSEFLDYPMILWIAIRAMQQKKKQTAAWKRRLIFN